MSAKETLISSTIKKKKLMLTGHSVKSTQKAQRSQENSNLGLCVQNKRAFPSAGPTVSPVTGLLGAPEAQASLALLAR